MSHHLDGFFVRIRKKRIKKIMSIPYIDIRISDKWKYAKVAFLVDREDFLKDIEQARKELGFSDLISYDKVDDWKEEESGKRRKSSIKGIRDIVLPFPYLDNLTYELLRKYKKKGPFFQVIKYSILCGIVTDNEFSRTAFCYIDEYDSFDPHILIVITPDTRPQEIVEMFRKEIPNVIQNYNRLTKSTTKKLDTISNIERNREWYWLRRSGLSWSKLHKEVTKGGLVISQDGIRDAVNEYEEHLMEL